MLLRTLLLSTLGAALAGLAGAQGSQSSIFIDIGSVGNGFGLPSNSYAAAGPAGGGMWNALDMDLVTGPVYVTPPLMDTAGGATTVTLEWDGQGFDPLPFFQDEPNTFGDDQALLDDIGYLAGPSTFTFRDLEPGVYDVITYAMAPDDSTFVTNVDVAGSADPAQDVGGDFSAGFVLGVTHSLHTVVVGMSGTIVIDINVAVELDSINGIQVFPSGGSGGIGTSYCGPANVNSTGFPAILTLSGSPVVSANLLTANVDSMPLNAFGFFLVSQAQGFVANPGGSQGNLCLGGAIGRYVGPGQIQNSGMTGSISLMLDLTMVPQPNGFVAVQPGETWNFTAWFRDAIMGSATSNFSQGVEIVFQ
ncbi:MAG: hypothetical protein AAF957_09295 [Planctomycetota bacterium]